MPRLQYRLNVAAILRKPDGTILIAERIDIKGAWQFPQGGIDPGESPEQTLARELREELGLPPETYVVRENRGPYKYVFGGGHTKKGRHGQIQTYFLADFLGPDSAIDVNTEHPEFQAVRWIRPEEFNLRWLPAMKRGVYTRVLRDFFGVEVKKLPRD